MRRAIVSSGLPLNAAVHAHSDLEFFRRVADSYNKSARTLQALASAVREIEEWARIHAGSIVNKMPEAAKLDSIREGWLGGTGLQALSNIAPEAGPISKDLYGYQLSWLIHATSQQLRHAGDIERADVLSKIALLVEIGVPSELAARIFLAGVRSRAASTELASVNVSFGINVSEIRRKLQESAFMDSLRPLVSTETLRWLELMVAEVARAKALKPKFPAFQMRGSEKANVLHARKLNEQIFLCTADGQMRIPVKTSERFPFDLVANDPRVAFVRSGAFWHLIPRDPRLEIPP